MGDGDITALDDSEEVAQQRESAAEPIHGREAPRKPLQPRRDGPRENRDNRPNKGPRPEGEAKGKGRDQGPRPQNNQGPKPNKKPRTPQDGQPQQNQTPKPDQQPNGDRPKIAPKIIPRGQAENKGGNGGGEEPTGGEGDGGVS
jgi:hypothetical protein